MPVPVPAVWRGAAAPPAQSPHDEQPPEELHPGHLRHGHQDISQARSKVITVPGRVVDPHSVFADPVQVFLFMRIRI